MESHIIKDVLKGSIANRLHIAEGDRLISINNETIEDIFDYHYFVQNEELMITIQKKDGTQTTHSIQKDVDEDLGIIFENGLLDDYRSCHNQCIFCFIDQMPKGMRETLYFKDDDSRLSFLQGNYVTLTNMSEHDIERIIRYHLAPINISIHTTNPLLRCEMLHNRFAGEALKKIDTLFAAGIEMNGQIVLCKGYNDLEQLEKSIIDLEKYIPLMKSVSVVPVGLTDFRDGLAPLEPFTREDALANLAIIEKYQNLFYEKYQVHFIHASDEFYLLAKKPMPNEEQYDGYLQYENGVGMVRLFEDEFKLEMDKIKEYLKKLYRIDQPEDRYLRLLSKCQKAKTHHATLVTGMLMGEKIKEYVSMIEEVFPALSLDVIPIQNDYFGHKITVSGLLTGVDIINQLQGKELGETVLLPSNLLRADEAVFLDDITLDELETALQVACGIVKSSGRDFIFACLGLLLPKKKKHFKEAITKPFRKYEQ